MFLLDRRQFLSVSGHAAATALAPHVLASPVRAAALDHSIFTASPTGAAVDSTLVLGEKKALLIDAQFTLPDARRLVDLIVGTGRELETVFVTHVHPDHHLGLAVIRQRFPGAKVWAHAAVVPQLQQAAPQQLTAMRQRAPESFVESVVIPEPLAGERLSLEGESFQVLAPMRGDTGSITAVWLPQFRALVASDLVYNGTHLWTKETTTPEAIAGWRESLDQLEKMGARIVVPGHQADGAVNDARGIAHTRRYLDAWQAALALARTADELIAAMKERVGTLPLEFMLQTGAKAAKG